MCFAWEMGVWVCSGASGCDFSRGDCLAEAGRAERETASRQPVTHSHHLDSLASHSHSLSSFSTALCPRAWSCSPARARLPAPPLPFILDRLAPSHHHTTTTLSPSLPPAMHLTLSRPTPLHPFPSPSTASPSSSSAGRRALHFRLTEDVLQVLNARARPGQPPKGALQIELGDQPVSRSTPPSPSTRCCAPSHDCAPGRGPAMPPRTSCRRHHH